MARVKVKFPPLLVRSLNINTVVELEDVGTIIDVYEKLSKANVNFSQRLFPDGKINRRIGVIVNDSLITSDSYDDVLSDGSEIYFQMPVAGG